MDPGVAEITTLEVSVHAGGKTSTQRFSEDSGPVLIGSAAHCIVRVLGLAPVAARFEFRDGAFELTRDGVTSRLANGATRIELDHVLIDFTQRLC